MAYIEIVEPGDATGELKDLYDQLVELAGAVPNIVKLGSRRPASAAGAQDLYQSVLYHDSGLSMIEKEAVAVAVSVINGCVYCYEHHGRALAGLCESDDLSNQLVAGDHSQLSGRIAAMVAFAVKLTEHPSQMRRADVESLSAAGLSDDEISDLTQLAAYFNYTNRLATGLGVDPEDWMSPAAAPR